MQLQLQNCKLLFLSHQFANDIEHNSIPWQYRRNEIKQITHSISPGIEAILSLTKCVITSTDPIHRRKMSPGFIIKVKILTIPFFFMSVYMPMGFPYRS